MKLAMWVLVAACAATAPVPTVVEATPAVPVESKGACADVAGTWEVEGCGGAGCRTRRRGCATSLECDGGVKSYTGSVSGHEVTYSGQNAVGITATCRATVRGDSMKGSCSAPGLPSCRFTATRQ